MNGEVGQWEIALPHVGTEQEQKLGQKPLQNNTMGDAREVLQWMRIAMSDLVLVWHWIYILNNISNLALPVIKWQFDHFFAWFYILSIVNCEWGSWKLGDCTTTCGDGTRTKTRPKTVTEQHNGRCEGSPSVNENCNERPCPSM